jgi:hypothetical protein
MSESKLDYDKAAYQDWYDSQNFQKYSESVLKEMDDEIRSKVEKELKTLIVMDPTEYMLYHKHAEIQDWLPTQSMSHINWVKRLIWKMTDKSDFRRIEPELIYVGNEIEVKTKNIWGHESKVELENKEPFMKHWGIMRTLISTGRNDGTIGRQIRFIVKDKNTKQYLGVICLSSSMAMLKPRNDAIGWDIDKNFQKGGKLGCLANGQSIIPTQPFGSAYLGGKLLSLLCLSDVVQKKWKELYKETLVQVDTTSLWGEMKGGQSQYDNLNPYWESKLGDTTGQTPLKPRDEVFFAMRDWMKIREPFEYWRHFVEKSDSGNLKMREHKTRAINFCYRKLGFKSKDFISEQKRGVYRAPLYKNGDEFLRDEITEEKLIPAHDFSIEALTAFWRFGSMGDTKVLDPETKKKLGDNQKKINMKRRMKGMVKGQVDSWRQDHVIQNHGSSVDWYLDLGSLSWQETRKRFLAQVGR